MNQTAFIVACIGLAVIVAAKEAATDNDQIRSFVVDVYKAIDADSKIKDLTVSGTITGKEVMDFIGSAILTKDDVKKGLEFETRKKEYMKELADGKRPDNAVTKAAAHRVVALILASIQSMWKWQTKNEKSLLRKMVYDNEDMFMTQVWIEKKTNSGSKIFQDVQKFSLSLELNRGIKDATKKVLGNKAKYLLWWQIMILAFCVIIAIVLVIVLVRGCRKYKSDKTEPTPVVVVQKTPSVETAEVGTQM
ncbi:Uncharacterized protein PBTT_06694 [Plasmodiophora brassicae]|uniref:Uncharacterized protein n=2 Tax=Plasmodiophora brassicae TaxID=37360 RepID=A0A3P3YB42_PLABS|nr:unnamed protein product [Plasmodiophora brassicae]